LNLFLLINASKNKFRTILRCFSDHPDDKKLLIPLGVRLSEPSNFEFRLAGINAVFLDKDHSYWYT